jgi:hypothetical protein
MDTLDLVPDRYDQESTLLHGNVCNLHLPIVYSGAQCAYKEHQDWQELPNRDCYMCAYPKAALVLAWEGEIVNEGCDRATRALNAARKKRGLKSTYKLFDDYGSIEEVLSLALECEDWKVGVAEIVEPEQAVE